MNNEPLYTREQAAEIFGVSPRTIDAWLRTGMLKGFVDGSLGSRTAAMLATAIADEACRLRGWLIFATHDVDEHPTRFGCAPALFADIVRYVGRSGARVLPVAEAWRTVLREGS